MNRIILHLKSLKKRPNILDIKKITNKKYMISEIGIANFNKSICVTIQLLK